MKKKFEPKVLTFKTRHSESQYLCTSKEECNKIVFEMYKQYFPQISWMDSYTERLTKPKYTIEEIENLPESMNNIKNKLRHELSIYNKDLKYYSDIQQSYKELKEIIDKDDIASFDMHYFRDFEGHMGFETCLDEFHNKVESLTPQTCIECPFYNKSFEDDKGICKMALFQHNQEKQVNTIIIEDENKKPEWCPIKTIILN